MAADFDQLPLLFPFPKCWRRYSAPRGTHRRRWVPLTFLGQLMVI